MAKRIVIKKHTEQRADWDSLPLVLTVNEVADILRISRAGAYNLINAEGLEKVTVGRKRIVVSRDKLKQLVEGSA